MSDKYQHLYQFCYVKIFNTNYNRNLLLLDYPGRVRSQITSVVYQIQRFDFDCNLVLTQKLRTPCARPKRVVDIRPRPRKRLACHLMRPASHRSNRCPAGRRNHRSCEKCEHENRVVMAIRVVTAKIQDDSFDSYASDEPQFFF